ncbi:MAG TPA: hypothetical protein VMT00_08850 [Thermoanaerobaculia bacterium]|nr:hypothetical protein [Thermoanaerobaculia bacterium]
MRYGTPMIVLLLLTVPVEMRAADLWLHVRIEGRIEGSPRDRSRIAINLPFESIGRALPALLQSRAGRCRISLRGEDLDGAELRSLVRAATSSANGIQATIISREKQLSAIREGETLVVTARERRWRNESEIRMPVWMAEALVSGRGDELDVAAAVREIVRRGEGDLLLRGSDGASVHIWADNVPD